MESTVLVDPEIVKRLEKLVRAALFCDQGPGARERFDLQVERFGTSSWPVYYVVSPEGEVLARQERPSDVPTFAAFLDSARP